MFSSSDKKETENTVEDSEQKLEENININTALPNSTETESQHKEGKEQNNDIKEAEKKEEKLKTLHIPLTLEVFESVVFEDVQSAINMFVISHLFFYSIILIA